MEFTHARTDDTSNSHHGRFGKGMDFCALRKTAAAMAARSGDPFAVQRLLGRVGLTMATRYVQNVSEQTGKAIENSRKYIIHRKSRIGYKALLKTTEQDNFCFEFPMASHIYLKKSIQIWPKVQGHPKETTIKGLKSGQTITASDNLREGPNPSPSSFSQPSQGPCRRP